jgi:hypothetical protein
VLSIECRHLEVQMKSCRSDQEIFKGDHIPVGRLLALNAPGKLGDRESYRMEDQLAEGFLGEEATSFAVGVGLAR